MGEKKNNIYLYCLLALTLGMFPTDALAGGFGELIKAGNNIFIGIRDIVYPASAVGIIAICICGAFGTINWKWLTAIIIGLVVISVCAGFETMFVGEEATGVIEPDVLHGA